MYFVHLSQVAEVSASGKSDTLLVRLHNDAYLFQGLKVWILPSRLSGLPSKQMARSSM